MILIVHLAIASLVLIVRGVDAAKIMMITFQQPSHVIMKLGIATDLIGRGHRVHFVLAEDNPIADSVRRLGINVISYRPALGVLNPYTTEFEDAISDMIFSRTLEQPMLSRIVHEDCKTMMSNRQFIDELKDLKFDMIVLEPFLVNPCYLLMPHELGVPYVMAIGIVSPLTLRIPALPSFSEFVPFGANFVQFPSLRTFADRFANAAKFVAFHNLVIPQLWADRSLMKQYAPEIDSWEELMLRSEMILVENDHVLNVAMALPPHVVTIAGCTTRSSQPLPELLEAIMEQSGENGVILASFGTTAHRFPSTCVAKFLKAFGRLRQTVVARLTVSANMTVSLYIISAILLCQFRPGHDVKLHPHFHCHW